MNSDGDNGLFVIWSVGIMVYSKNGTVSGSMCDSSVKLSPLAVFQLVEDTATELMGELHNFEPNLLRV